MKIKVIKYKTVKSTNDVAHRLIHKNQYRPAIIFSDAQRKGRGTMGKKWVSQKGNIFLSILFQINQKKINFKQFSVLNAFLMKKIICKLILKKIDIKFPNDLLFEKKKICGILQELVYMNKKSFLIVGIGLNTNKSPTSKIFLSTSLKKIIKKDIDNKEILKNIKNYYEKFLNEIKKTPYFELKKKYKI